MTLSPRVTTDKWTDSRSQHISPWVRLFPIFFFLVYLGLTIFLFAFGPWEWPVQDGTNLYLFLLLAHSSLFFGYFMAAFQRPRTYSERWNMDRVVQWSVIISIALLIPTAASRIGTSFFNIGQSLTDPGSAYYKYQLLRESRTPMIEYVRLVFGPFTAMLFPLLIFYRQRLGPLTCLAGSIGVLGTILLFIGMGTNKAIADVALLFPWLVVASHLAGVSRLQWRAVIPLAFTALLCFAGFLVFFASTMATRTGSSASVGYFPGANLYVDRDNFLVKDLPPGFQIGAFGLDNYLTQGYYALYLSLKEPFVPMFGVGNSMFLTRQVDRLESRPEIWKFSYPARIEKYGWDSVALWSSIYPWIASDVSFPGTLVFVFIIGRLLALSWLDTLKGTNPFAVAFFGQLVIMLFYFPANNQLLQSGDGLTGFVGIFLLWIATRRKATSQQPAHATALLSEAHG